MIKKYLNKDIIIILLSNIFLADIVFILFPLMMILVIAGFSGNHQFEKYYLIYTIALLIIWGGHFFVLPILYSFMEKKSKSELVQNFIFKLKSSTKMNFIVLGCSFIEFYIICLTREVTLVTLLTNLSETLAVSIFFELPGAYLFLYLYWYIESIIKSKKGKHDKKILK